MIGGGQTTLVELDRDECLRLLAEQAVGRLAVSQRHRPPLVVPVNYVLDGDRVLFRSGYGTKLLTMAGRRVSFEVDWLDPVACVGWSVLAYGRAAEIRLRDAGPVLPEPWVPDDKPYLVSVKVGAVSGRRIDRAG